VKYEIVRSGTLETLVADTPADAERWVVLVGNSPIPDVYYLPAYAGVASEIERTEPVAVVGGTDSCGLLAPILIRNMSAEANGSSVEWTDACSPYGYGGLLSLSGCQHPVTELHCFIDDLRAWCSNRNIVCCVIRLHPLMKQGEWFTSEDQKLVRLRIRGNTTAINLKKWDDGRERPYGMRKGRHSDLNAAHRTLRLKWSGGEDDDAVMHLERFAALYAKSIEAYRGEDFYKFPLSYFSRLASLGSHIGIASAWLENQLAGASIFLAGRDYAHYHLAAVNEIGMKHKAATLLVIEGAKWARQRGCWLLHLGGGLNPGDSLEDFKLSFGGELYQYAYLICVADPARFEQLCQLLNAPWPYSGAAKMSSIEGTSS